ncbi:MAG TPA: tetratricopeptide repeat protein [Verrucomicrobiae bacterium]
MKDTRFNVRRCKRYALALWLICQHLSSGFCAEPVARITPVIPLIEIIKRWQPLNLAEVVAAAEKGDLTAQHYLGYYHTEGLGKKADREEGMRWYRKAAAAGFPNSLNNLGVLYFNGNGVEKDEAKALEYFRQAGERGMWRSVRQAANIVVRQPDGFRKKEEFRQKIEKAALAGDTEAQLQLGYFYLNPPGGDDVNVTSALKMFKQAAELGHMEALTALGNVYMETRGHIDYAQAMKWHRLAAEKEQPASELAVGWMYFHGYGVERNVILAVEWTERGALRNHPQGWYNLGRFFSGESLANPPKDFIPDYVKAHDYLEKGMNAGHMQSAQLLGKLIWEEKIPWREKEEAKPYFELAKNAGNRAAREFLQLREMDEAAKGKNEVQVLNKFAIEGNTTALSRLAELHRDGSRVKADPIKAYRYEAALQMNGVASSESILAQMTGFSRIMTAGPDGKEIRNVSQREKEFTPVYQALTKALKKNDGAHFYALARRYVDGKEMPQDLEETCFWLYLAASTGNSTAKTEVAELAGKLDESQLQKMKVWIGWMREYQNFIR